MSNEILLLDKNTIDKIAAGEVIERPMSIVKELVENSLDSKANAITVEIEEGGTSLIRVTDNGSGISAKYVPTAFLRHATSKINDSKDLFALKTLGFRGEALASIAAVSKVELITKTSEDIVGFRYLIEGGTEISGEEIGAPEGTSIFIRDLFYNTPARKKFLKSPKSEANKIIELMEQLALSRADISFKLISNKKERLLTTGSGNLKNTIFEVYGMQSASSILDISYEDELLHVNGFIGKSILSRANRNFESFFINGRYIKSKLLSDALEDGYRGFLMGHQFPFAVISLHFPEGLVDVNVHPSKMEVRFEEPERIWDILSQVVRQRLTQREDIEQKPLVREEEKTIPILEKSFEPFEAKRLSDIKEVLKREIKPDSPYEPKYDRTTQKEEQVNRIIEYEQQVFLSKEAYKSHEIIGQVFGTYWLVEYDGKLYIIDQHAAHEKILFEKTMEKLKTKEVYSQQISPPIVVSLSAFERENLSSYGDALSRLGFVIEPFGGNEVAITGVPADFIDVDSKDLFLEIVSKEPQKKGELDIVLERVASISCKAAVKGNHKLSDAEIRELIKALIESENPYHCPHGRPTMISFSRYELDKKFKRIV